MFCGSYTFGHSSLLTLLALGDSSSSKCLIFLGFSLASLLNFHAFLVAIPKDLYTLDGVGFCLCCEYSEPIRDSLPIAWTAPGLIRHSGPCFGGLRIRDGNARP